LETKRKRLNIQKMAEEDGPLFPDRQQGITKIKNLTRWSDTLATPKAGAESASSEIKFRFEYNPEITKKIIYWEGDLTKLDVDAIVNSTNESLNEKNGLSEKILQLGGDELLKECTALEGCRTGEAKITGAYSLPCRYVIHTVGPRFNLKYKTAAESALHNCYRSTLELVKEYELNSVAFTVINTARRGYPPESGAHMALRTVRRFLERYGKGIDTVILCVTEELDKKAYAASLPLYFPRSVAEAEEANKLLPEDIGNEMGEPVQEERKIRIREIPGLSARMNIPVVSEDDPLRAWARDSDDAVSSFVKMQGDHDAIRKEEINVKLNVKGTDAAIQKYSRLLKRARAENLQDIAAKNIIFQTGIDSLGRPIVCVNGKAYHPDQVDKEKVLLYMVQYLDSISSKDYVVVYFNAEATSENHPDLAFVREVYGSLHPKYRRNLKILYIVHPTWWVRLTITVMNTFFTSDIREKIKNVDTLAALYESISHQQLSVPEYVLAYDRKVSTGVSLPVLSSHHDDL